MLLCLLSCCVVFRCLLSPPSSAVSCRAVPSSRRFRHRQSGPAVCRALRESYRFDSSSRHGFAIPPDCSSLPPRYTQSCRFAAALMPTAQQFTHMSPMIQLLPGARRSVASRMLRRTAERASFWHMATRTARYPSRIRIRPDGGYPEPAARGCARTQAWRMRSATARSTTSVIS